MIMAKQIKCWESNDGQKFDSKNEAVFQDAVDFAYKEIAEYGSRIAITGFVKFMLKHRRAISAIYDIIDEKK